MISAQFITVFYTIFYMILFTPFSYANALSGFYHFFTDTAIGDIPAFKFDRMLPANKTKYFRYSGSLTAQRVSRGRFLGMLSTYLSIRYTTDF